MPWIAAAIAARIEYVQRLYDASGRPPGIVLYRNSAGWYVKCGKRYERLGRKWRDVEWKLRGR